MSNDIRSILDRLATVEGRLTPAQQKVPQLPALFKPRHIRALGSKTDPAHPMDGYMVGENALAEAMQEVEEDMISRVKHQFADYLEKLEKQNHLDSHLVKKAKHDLEIGDDQEVDEQDDEEEFGSDASDDLDSDDDSDEVDENATWDQDVQPIGDPADTEVAHGVEDHIAASVAAPAAPMSESPARTYTLEDGTCLECWGDDESGYEVRHGERRLPTRFPRIDHADMAVKLFQKRRQRQDLSQDYIEER
jgi:hypothetical protein